MNKVLEIGFIFSLMRKGNCICMHLIVMYYARWQQKKCEVCISHFIYSITHIVSSSQQTHNPLNSSREWWIMQLTHSLRYSVHMSAQNFDVLNNFCDVVCLKFKFLCGPPSSTFFERSNAPRSHAFYKGQW